MADRAETERFVRDLYAARERENLDEILAFFHADACFAVNGAASGSSRDECIPVIRGLLDTFQLLDHSIHLIVIDGDKAAVYWRGRFRGRPTGRVAETELLDLIELKNGRVIWMKTFFDTATAAQLAGS